MFSDSLDEVSDDRGVGVEKIVSGHTWLSWDTSWDDDDFGALKAFANVLWVVALDLCACWDMGQISSDTWCTLQIEQAELSDVVVELAEEREWLTDTTVCTVYRQFLSV